MAKALGRCWRSGLWLLYQAVEYQRETISFKVVFSGLEFGLRRNTAITTILLGRREDRVNGNFEHVLDHFGYESAQERSCCIQAWVAIGLNEPRLEC